MKVFRGHRSCIESWHLIMICWPFLGTWRRVPISPLIFLGRAGPVLRDFVVFGAGKSRQEGHGFLLSFRDFHQDFLMAGVVQATDHVITTETRKLDLVAGDMFVRSRAHPQNQRPPMVCCSKVMVFVAFFHCGEPQLHIL